MIVIIDNYDSFTYNLVQRIGELDRNRPMRVLRNDKTSIAEIESLKPTHILISPGPCSPKEAGISNEVLLHFGPKLPTFGVCLGHQCIGQLFGGKVVRAPRVMHGKTSEISHDGEGLFAGLPTPFTATRYHSLIVERDSVPDVLTVTAESEDGLVMGLRHRELPIVGVQFHPESILTHSGHDLLRNFLALTATNSRFC
ncbi:MAG: anthranilate synthase component II [Phycisphaerae bacterium]